MIKFIFRKVEALEASYRVRDLLLTLRPSSRVDDQRAPQLGKYFCTISKVVSLEHYL